MRRPIALTVVAAALAALAVAGATSTVRRARAGAWTSLLAPAPVRRLRAAVVVEARDCPATLAVAEWFARPELAGAVGSVTVVVRDGRDSLARYADAALTLPVHLAVVPVPPPLRAAVRRLGPGPRLALVDADGRVVLAVPIPDTIDALARLERLVEQVADLWLATELATTRTVP